ncbi:hypothetical protein BGZ49_004543 [Haplosporangium sp. Z 27]|nr:hypothetical protein BGZ49_004543 [Haplosporangium sp. Z 27]
MSDSESESDSQVKSQEEIVRGLYKFIEGLAGAAYFISNDPSTYSQAGYVQFRGQFAVEHNNACMKEFNQFMDIFRKCRSKVHQEFARSTKRVTKKIVRQYSSGSIADVNSEANSSFSIEANSSSFYTGSSSSVLSASTLCSSLVNTMKEEFNVNYESYKGTSWVLPSGSVFDAVVRGHVLAQTKQRSIHSFVWDSKDDLRELFPLEEDNQALQQRINSIKEAQPQLPQWQNDIISGYNSLQSIEDAILNGINQKVQIEGVEEQECKKFNKMIFEFMTGVTNFYEDHGRQNELKEGLSEKTHLKLWSIFFKVLYKHGGVLDLDEGEIYSKASALRKNSTRGSTENRQSSGRKIDGIIYCLKASKLEIAGIEGGKKNEGPNGTKILLDGLKMSKLLKDMFDKACIEACSKGTLPVTARNGVVVFGFLVSGCKIQFVSLKHFGGRFSYLIREKAESLPLHLDDQSFLIIKSILRIFLRKRLQMEDAASRLGNMINKEYDNDNVEEFMFVSTLTTPPSSPVFKKLRL